MKNKTDPALLQTSYINILYITVQIKKKINFMSLPFLQARVKLAKSLTDGIRLLMSRFLKIYL
jgi:hypothetical protein